MTMFFSLGDLCVDVSTPLFLSLFPLIYVCVFVCVFACVLACVLVLYCHRSSMCASLRKGLIKERVYVSEQLMRFGPMS